MGLTCWHFREKGTLVFVDSALVTLILRLFEEAWELIDLSEPAMRKRCGARLE